MRDVGLFIPVPAPLRDFFPHKDEDPSTPHITFLIVGEVPDARRESFLLLIEQLVRRFPGPVEAQFDGLDTFSNPENLVLFSRIRFSQDLRNFRQMVRETLLDHGFPLEDSFPRWNPHATIRYLDPLHELEYRDPLEGRWTLEGLELWVADETPLFIPFGKARPLQPLSPLYKKRLVALREATKSRTEREDEKAQQIVRKSPEKNPPRRDLEKRDVSLKDDEDPDEKRDQKDRSNNYKDAAERVAWLWLAKGKSDTPSWAKGKFTSDETGNKVTFNSLPPKQQARLRAEHEEEGAEEESPAQEKAPEEEPEKDPSDVEEEDPEEGKAADEEARTKLVNKLTERGSFDEEVSKLLEDLTAMEAGEVGETFDREVQALRKTPPPTNDFREQVRRAQEALDSGSKKNLGSNLATLDHWKKVVDNPLVDLEEPISDKEEPLNPVEANSELRKAMGRSSKAVAKYRELSPEDRKRHYTTLEGELEGLPQNSLKRIHLEAVQRGIGFASALQDGDEAEGIGSAMASLTKAAEKSGSLEKLMGLSTFGSSAANDQLVMRQVYDDLSPDDWEDILPEDHPGRALAELLGDEEDSKFMTDSDREEVKAHLIDLMMADVVFLGEQEKESVGARSSVREKQEVSKDLRKKAVPKKRMPSRQNLPDMLSWFEQFLKNLASGH